ncbi:MAG: hypothetical protein ACRBK7_22885 [Acidimicrobiales bacterium]
MAWNRGSDISSDAFPDADTFSDSDAFSGSETYADPSLQGGQDMFAGSNLDQAEFDELLSAAGAQSQPVRRRSWLSGLLWALSLVPTAALALLGSMALRVRLDDGVWPIRNQPDPKDLGLHNTVTIMVILASFVVVLLVPLIALAGYFSGNRRVPVAPPVVGVVTLAILLAILVGDLGGLGEWIGD